MKVNMSYELRGARVHTCITVPEPTVDNLTAILKKAARVAGRAAPEIEIIES